MDATQEQPQTPEERLAVLRNSHPHSTTETMKVQAFRTHADGLVEWVVVGGAAYRRVEDQPHILRMLQDADMTNDFLERFGLAAFDAMYEIARLNEEDHAAERDAIEKRLTDRLACHKPIIEWCFAPDFYSLTFEEETRHRWCHLPPAPKEHSDD